VAEVELRYLWDGQRCENTLYFHNDDGWDLGALASLAGAVKDWAIGEILPLQSSTVSLVSVKAASLESETALAVETSSGLPVAGSNNNPSLPNNVSLAIKFSTPFRGRSSRGRNYILGITEESVTANQVTSGFTAAYIAAYGELADAVATAVSGTSWIVYSRFTDGAERVTGLAQPITDVSFTDNVIDSMRRRLPGRGQ
jgi:hypothetical protein